jgi:hypothetical protein
MEEHNSIRKWAECYAEMVTAKILIVGPRVRLTTTPEAVEFVHKGKGKSKVVSVLN